MTPKEEAYQKIQAYLYTHKKRLEIQNVDMIVWELRTYVPGTDALLDGELRATAMIWRSLNGPTYPLSTTPPPTMPESKVLATVKSALTTVVKGIDLKHGDGKVNIAVTGVTAELTKGDTTVSVGRSWGGTVSLEAKRGDFHFAGELSSEGWKITLSYPEDTVIPDLSKLGKIFGEGEKGLRGMASTLSSFPNVQDPKVKDAVQVHVKPIGEAVDAAKGIAKAPAKGVSVGITIGTPDQDPRQGVPPPSSPNAPRGVQGVITLTIKF